MIIQLWVTMLRFSYVSAWVEKYKQETGNARKSLKASESIYYKMTINAYKFIAIYI